ncbi:MAG: DUF4258 domain-containing protein [Euryarchaeota archaeon]|nr:DUF4258 domain-containing protein [Euryarchaeota archaeon]
MSDIERERRNMLFEVVSKLDKRIRITKNYWDVISSKKHPSVANMMNEARLALIDPFEVRGSRQDPNVILYYRKLNNKFICTVVKHLNREGFIITVYLTYKIKRGEVLWKKS